MNLRYIKLFEDIVALAEPLNDQELGRLFRAICDYGLRDLQPTITGNQKYVFPMFKRMIDNSKSAYESKVQNGRKGGIKKSENRAKETEQKAKESETVANCSETVANCSESEKNQDTRYKNQETRIKKQEQSIVKRFTPPALQEVSDYIKEQKYSFSAESFFDFYSSKGWKVGNSPMKDWKAACRNWSRNDYGVGQKKPAQKVLNAQNYEQRPIDNEQIEAMRVRRMREILEDDVI